MNDRMDQWLVHLPSESPAPDLAARIIAAVASRRRAQARWRQLSVLAAVGLAVGTGLVVLSWAEVTSFLAPHVASAGATDFSQMVAAYLASPLESVSGWADSVLSLQSALSEGIGAAFSLGIVLMAMAAFGGLARLLRHSPPADRYSHSMGR